MIGRSSSKTPPRSAPEVEQPPTAETDENIWGKRNALTSACPYCGEIQDPPPKRKKKCRACGKPIRPVMRGGRRMLLTEDAYARLMRQEAKARVLRQSHSKAIRADLRRMQTTGITQVQVLTAQDERVCAHCRHWRERHSQSRRHRRGTCSLALIAMRATADAYISRSFPVYPNKRCLGTSAPRTDGRTASPSRKLATIFNWPRKRINSPDDFPL